MVDASPQTVKVSGYQAPYSMNTAFYTFDLIFSLDCSTNTVTPNVTSATVTHLAGSITPDTVYLGFTSLYSTCGSTVYSFTVADIDCGMSQAELDALATISLFTNDEAQVEIAASSSPVDECQVTVSVEAEVSGITAVSTITVTIQDCTKVVISTESIPNKAYDINDGMPLTLALFNWTMSLASVCDPLVYDIVYSNYSSVDPAVIFLDTGYAYVDTTDPLDVASHSLLLRG